MRKTIQELRERWASLTLYEKFEQVIALVLTWLISLIIVFAVVDVAKEMAALLGRSGLHPFEHAVFQTLFGEIVTVLIAMEFKHSILKVTAGRQNIIQARTILLISLLALARKFMILDTENTSAGTIAALALAVVTLSVSYWMICERESCGKG